MPEKIPAQSMQLKLTDSESDQLKETLHIATGQASTALAKLIKKKILVGLSDVFVEKIENVPSHAQILDEVVAGIVFKLLGEINGTMLLILPEKNALALSGTLTDSLKSNSEDLSEMGISALEEVGNILAGHAITALWNFLGRPIKYSPPTSNVDMASAILEGVITDIGSRVSEVIVFETKFTVEREDEPNRMIFIFTPPASQKILDILKAKFNAGNNH